MSNIRNLTGVKFAEIRSISVNEFHALPDGQGKPEQVHLWIELADLPFPLVMRFKSRKPVDELIVALMVHARSVWPDKADEAVHDALR